MKRFPWETRGRRSGISSLGHISQAEICWGETSALALWGSNSEAPPHKAPLLTRVLGKLYRVNSFSSPSSPPPSFSLSLLWQHFLLHKIWSIFFEKYLKILIVCQIHNTSWTFGIILCCSYCYWHIIEVRRMMLERLNNSEKLPSGKARDKFQV